MKFILMLIALNMTLLSCGQSNFPQNNDLISLSVEVDKKNKSCFFKLTNNSQHSIQTTPIAGAYSRIIYVDKDNNVQYNYYMSGHIFEVIAPGEIKIWEHDYIWTMLEDLERHKVEEPGFYWILYDKSDRLPPPHLKFEDRYKSYRSEVIKIEIE